MSEFIETKEVVNPVLIKNLKEEINMENKHYIIRGDRSGVFFGQIAGRNGQEVELRNVRKLWYWEGACADVSKQGRRAQRAVLPA